MSQLTTNQSTIEYETTTFQLKPDELGPNKATLLHARTPKPDNQYYKSILYIHGYSDYYFHDHVCMQFLSHGYDFFALDLRKCGRSIIQPEQDQYKHYCNDLREYDEEITLAIERMLQEGKSKTTKLILLGHSTGGLIVSLYASSGPKRQHIDAIILNSPYLSPLETNISESILETMLTKFGLSTDIDDNWYGRSIHVKSKGEWDFDLTKKPIDRIRLHGRTFAAIRLAQEDLTNRNSCIKCPILLMCSSRSIKPEKKWRDEYANVDLLLNVITMRRVASNLGPYVTMHEIENAKHDIFLSQLDVREKAFHVMFQWLKHLEHDWRSTRTT